MRGRGGEGTVRGDDSSALEAVDLTRDFGPLRAVDGVSFELTEGEFLTVFGPNGAGKTSLLRMLGGGLRPTGGEVRLHGVSLEPGSGEWRREIGVLSHQTFLYDHLTVEENLSFYGRLYDLGDLEGRVPRRLRRVGLLDRSRDRVATLSRGMRQRLALARTLLHDPTVVLLDEPYTGLDAHAAALLRDVLRTLKDGRRTVVLTTHNLGEGLHLADRVAIQVRGRFAHLGPSSALDPSSVERFYREIVEDRG